MVIVAAKYLYPSLGKKEEQSEHVEVNVKGMGRNGI